MADINWESLESHAFINPRIPEIEREALLEIKHDIQSHIFLTTSGTERLKWVALSKQAFLASAAGVNQQLEASSKDIWVNALPFYHVGGLSIYARAYLSKTYVYRYDHRWNPIDWAKMVEDKRGSLASLVPTQLFDLVKENVAPPTRLRRLLIGGQKLQDDLYKKALAAGWPIMPTFGMTECCSQIATADLGSSQMKLLPHVQAKISPSGKLCIKSEALLTAYLSPEYHDPKLDGWFETDDLARLEGDILIPLGRSRDVIKIGGELINLFHLEHILADLKYQLGTCAETTLVPVKDERLGHKLHLYHTPCDIKTLLEHYHKRVMPFARIEETKELDCLPKTSLGKLTRTLL